ncbi:ABC transporter permease [Bartonella sp. HY329]|uniref:ABC transporter permease n=1 Tax=unclassified Bartonella TaxID=2645622 RepID=UPI0021CA7B5D|nr:MULTISPECIES: ABC transporter permease [unclassified Bartonella]UXM94413.1 ABC transporter permease [Bartonella sp. HY329]UXN08737.1 ABC transporter permease [Bartonella sp. HY328]
MNTKHNTASAPNQTAKKKIHLPPEVGIFFVLIGIALAYEAMGWLLVDQSFLWNAARLKIMILQVSVIGIISIGVTQVIITGGIDLSSGSVVAMSAMIAACFAQSSSWASALYPQFTDLPAFIPILIGVLIGLIAGLINGALIAFTKIPPFIATLGMMVSARGVAKWITKGQPVSGFTEQFSFIGSGWWPVVIFLVLAVVFHIVLRYTRYGKYTYAIGANVQAARVSGINVDRHLIKVYAIAGALAGLAGVITASRALTAQSAMGLSYELDAIAAAVIGGTSLSGGVGRIPGTVIGTLILGVMLSGFTFLRLDAYYQEIVKGVIVVVAVIIDVYRQKRKKRS